MSYDAMVDQLKAVPQECLAEIETYIQFVLFRNNISVNTTNNKNLSKYYGTVNFKKDALSLQKEMRNEWN